MSKSVSKGVGMYGTDREPTAPQLEAELATERPTADGSVRLDGVAVQFGGRTIWRDATASIVAGEFVVVLGPNGAGKSTLLRLLLGLVRQSRGSVQALGAAPRRGNPLIGYVPQRRTLGDDLTVRGRDLVALGVDGHRWGFGLPGAARADKQARVQEALVAVDAATYGDQPIGQLSGGERQRLLLAQALVGRPRLLLLDEPLASLDLRNQIAVAQLVARLARAQGMTVLLVAHDINPLLPVLDRVLHIAHGQVTCGTPGEVITTEQLSALYDAPVEVVRDSRGRVFVVGLEAEEYSHHPEPEAQ